jgi:hypothetical protein
MRQKLTYSTTAEVSAGRGQWLQATATGEREPLADAGSEGKDNKGGVVRLM